MIRRLLSTVLLVTFVGAVFAGSLRAQTNDTLIKVAGEQSVAFTVESDQEAPGSFEFPVLLKGGARPTVHVDLVRATLDDQPADIKNYKACLARPSAGRSLWDLRIDSTKGPFADGKHDITVMAWSDKDTTASATVCGTGQRGAPPPAACPGNGCAVFDITIDIKRQSAPKREGKLLTVIGPNNPILPFDASGKPGPISVVFTPGEGVDPRKLWLFPVTTTSPVTPPGRGFSTCIRPAAQGSGVPTIVVRPEDDEYRPATYTLSIYAVLSEGKGKLCDDPGMPPEFPHTGECDEKAENGKERTCQLVPIVIVRKPGKLLVPSDIAINIERFPFAEVAEYFDRKEPGSWDLRRHSTPISIRESGDEGAVDLGSTDLAIAVAEKSDPTRSGTITFRPVADAKKVAVLAPIGPGGSIELTPDRYDLPNGFGAYEGKLKLTPVAATADAKEVSVAVTVHMSAYALGLAIIAGIYIGYRYRLRFELGIPRDQALMGARRVLNKLIRHRDSARDRNLIKSLETAIADLRRAMFAAEVTEVSITEASEAAQAALTVALGKLADDSTKTAEMLDPWSDALQALSKEPAEIEQAFSAVRKRVDTLRQLLNDGDVASVNDPESGLSSLPKKAGAALRQVDIWLNANKSPILRTATRWAVLRQSLGKSSSHIESAENSVAIAHGGSVTAEKMGMARDSLATVLQIYDIEFRRFLLSDIRRFVPALAALANSNGIETNNLLSRVQALATIADDPDPEWPITRFSDSSTRLFRSVEKCSSDLIEKGVLGSSTGAQQTPVELAIAAWIKGDFGDPASMVDEAADDDGVTEIMPSYRIVPPLVVYQHEPQIWRLEVSDGETAMPHKVQWNVGKEEVAVGVRAYLTIDAPSSVSAKVTTASGTSTYDVSVSPVETSGPTDIAALHKRITREIRQRTLWNGVLITIFGVAVIGTFTAGYPGLVAAFAWGLAADLSADKLTTVLGRAPST